MDITDTELCDALDPYKSNVDIEVNSALNNHESKQMTGSGIDEKFYKLKSTF